MREPSYDDSSDEEAGAGAGALMNESTCDWDDWDDWDEEAEGVDDLV